MSVLCRLGFHRATYEPTHHDGWTRIRRCRTCHVLMAQPAR